MAFNIFAILDKMNNEFQDIGRPEILIRSIYGDNITFRLTVFAINNILYNVEVSINKNRIYDDTLANITNEEFTHCILRLKRDIQANLA